MLIFSPLRSDESQRRVLPVLQRQRIIFDYMNIKDSIALSFIFIEPYQGFIGCRLNINVSLVLTSRFIWRNL
ncbi:hypothetical protein XB02_06610 [Pantoea ananatis]|nr:hypothetical protein XB02_06610 [Pantoea ananatis]